MRGKFLNLSSNFLIRYDHKNIVENDNFNRNLLFYGNCNQDNTPDSIIQNRIYLSSETTDLGLLRFIL